MKYTTEQLEAIAAKLREMPPVEKKKQEHSKQGAVRVLSKEIAAAATRTRQYRPPLRPRLRRGLRSHLWSPTRDEGGWALVSVAGSVAGTARACHGTARQCLA